MFKFYSTISITESIHSVTSTVSMRNVASYDVPTRATIAVSPEPVSISHIMYSAIRTYLFMESLELENES